MKVLVEGHTYEVENFENKSEKGQIIQFIHKEPTEEKHTPSDDGRSILVEPSVLKTVSDGTTNEELMEVLINRISYLQSKFPCRENALTITKLEEALMWQNKRTADRLKRKV